MSDRYKGAILSPTAPTVTPQSAGGIYTSSQQLQYQGQGVWPSAFNNPINNSLRFRSSATAYLSRTPASAGNRRTWTYSIWFKQGKLDTCAPFLGYWQNASIYNSELFLESTQNDATRQLKFYDYDGTSQFSFATTQSFRDVSAWYHLMVAFDSTQATDTNRVKIYLNGSQITSFSTTIYPTQNFQCNVFNNNITNWIGYNAAFGGGNAFDGYLTEVNFIDGLALTPSSFGTTDAYGIWQPIPYTGTYGTNGFYLKFTDNSALTTSSNVGLGKDFSGNANYWVTNGISITAGSTYDSMKDVPTNTNSNTANYCVLNQLAKNSGLTTANGNLSVSGNVIYGHIQSTIFASSGKFYFEAQLTTQQNDTAMGLGNTNSNPQNDFAGGSTNSVGYLSDGRLFYNGSLVATYSSYTTTDVVACAFDCASGKIWIAKNNTWQNSGDPAAGTGSVQTVSWSEFTGIFRTVGSGAISANFGQRPFSYTPPTGFLPLNTYNLPTPTILAGNQYMNITLYTGTGTAGQVQTNSSSMQPDLTWIKQRNGTGGQGWWDAVRGATKYLASQNTDAEGTSTVGVTSFNSNGFTVGSDSWTGGNGSTYVGWQWRASNAAGVSNTQGTITSTVSVNTTAGFSIVLWTGNGVTSATVGHGLGVVPAMIICKERSASGEYWHVKHQSTASNTNLFLNQTLGSTSAASVGDGVLADLSSSTTFGFATAGSPGNVVAVNENGVTNVAYCFAAVSGYSAFGSYTGNGSTDGPFVFTGFRPRWVMVKNITSAQSWQLMDTSRSTYNVATANLLPNSSSAELTGTDFIDMVSNGFKIRQSSAGNWNNSGDTYIYACFAENPFKISRAR